MVYFFIYLHSFAQDQFEAAPVYAGREWEVVLDKLVIQVEIKMLRDVRILQFHKFQPSSEDSSFCAVLLGAINSLCYA